jgi:hypothetical protein
LRVVNSNSFYNVVQATMSLAARPSSPRNSNMSKQDFLDKVGQVHNGSFQFPYFTAQPDR